MEEAIIKTGKYQFKDIVKDPEKYEKTNPQRKFKINPELNPQTFTQCLVEEGVKRIYPRSQAFIIDEANREAIAQMYFYLAEDKERFRGDLWKGFILSGAYGTGKTLLLRGFYSVLVHYGYSDYRYLLGYTRDKQESLRIETLGARRIHETRSHEYGETIIHETPGILFVDDIGKEPLQVNNFGTKSFPMEDAMEYRYANRLLTFGSTNLKIDEMPYSGHCIDRMRAMFNIIELPGKSRRI